MLSPFGTPETERRFLVGSAWPSHVRPQAIRQGYLPTLSGLTLRIRWTSDLGTVTVKTPALLGSRWETEWPLLPAVALALLDLCPHPPIEKLRRVVEHDGLTWEIDEYLGRHAGLVVAEVELAHPLQQFQSPDWLGQEVTGIAELSNSRLARTPSLEPAWAAVVARGLD
ncbi:MAG: CYTH domain-containing protein [Alphaproteobacteria bacterium]|nr:CYTH domain-containing protein [Alphaproteobacteria bacterium]